MKATAKRPAPAAAALNGRLDITLDGHDPNTLSRLSEEARDTLEYVSFVWPTGDDSIHAAQIANLDCESSTRATESFVRQRQIVVASRDDDEGYRQARELAQRCIEFDATSVRIWKVPEFGSIYPTLRDWCSNHDLVRTLEVVHLGRYAEFVVFVGASPLVSPDFTEPPRPIAADLLPVPGLDPLMVPAPFREWAKDIANRGWFPLEYVVAAIIVGVSGLIGRRIAIRPKRHDDWLVVPNLWGAIVGPPGIQKSPAIEEALRPLNRLASDAIEAHKGDLVSYEEQKLVADSKRAAAKTRLKDKANKRASDETLAALAREALADSGSSPPTPRRYLVNDATVEKLGELLAENPNGLTVFRDELSGFLKTMDRQGHEGDRGFFLESWNGNGSYTWDRIGRGMVHVPSVCLAVFGTIQPGPLSRHLRASISGEEADGFIPRFQILFYPDPPMGFINVDRYPDTEAKNEAYAVFKALDRLEPAVLGCAVDQERGIPYTGFSRDAQDFFDEWRVELERRLRSGALSNVMETHLAKYRSLLPSLALVFHLIDAHAQSQLPPVTVEAAKAAAAWCELLECHARRIYQAGADGDPDDAIRLAERIKQSLPNPFTIRDVQRKGWSGLSSNEEVRRAIGVLEDRGWVKVLEVASDDSRGRGRPSEQVWINPRILPENTEAPPPRKSETPTGPY